MEKTNRISAGERIRNFVKENGSFVIFMLICLLASCTIPRFASIKNFALILKQAAIPIIGCLGMTCVLMTGGIDLSLGYMIGLSSISIGLLIKTYEVPIALSICLTLLLGAAVGLINGLCVQKIRVPAFITTLGTGYVLLGVAQIISNGASINRLPQAFLILGKTKVLGKLNTTVLISLAFCAVFYYLLHCSTFGRRLSAFGLSEPTSRLSGIQTSRINISAYVICAVLASVCGMLLSIDVNCAQPTMGGGDYTFTIITGCVLGGVSLFGGVGSVPGVIFGMLTLKVINNCINLMNAPYYLGSAIQGIVILLDIILENIKNRKL
ncbi:MAG: ABC transporter permease [Clostridiales bacterium]|nr:ABC transporter permease [Clostridiales bacterium]